MADKQIGIKLNVQSTGLQQVDSALDTISKNLSSMNDTVTQRQQQGWGTDKQTKALQEQLRYMQQLLQMSERIARTANIDIRNNKTFGNLRSEIGLMQRDIGGTASYRSGMSGWIHSRFGSSAATGFERMTGYADRAAALYGSFDVFSTIRNGMNTGTQLAYGYGDLAKRMNPSVNSLQYGISLNNALQGYGYSDQDLLQAATTYGAATGRINPNSFKNQMRSIEQVGRNYGLDLSGVTQYFSNAWTSGVTGGSKAQMSPQELANLTANAVIRGNMHGKESQVMSQMQQIMQMNVANSGNAGDISQLTGLLTLINKSGNQGLINNAGNIMGGLNNMIQSPGGGYAGQAMVWQALSKAHPGMSYFQLSDLASQGIAGSGNLSAVLNYVSGLTKNKDQQAYMLSQMGAGNQHMLRQFLDTAETPDGKFNQKAIDNFAKNAKDHAVNNPQNATDQIRNNNQSKDHAANSTGMKTSGERSSLNALQGDFINIAGAPLTDLGMAYFGMKGLKGVYNFGKGALNIGKNVLSKVGSTAAESGGSWLGRIFGGLGTGAAEVGTAGALEGAGLAADSTGIGLPLGIALGIAGLGVGAYEMFKPKTGSSSKSASSSGDSSGSNPMTTGSELAPIVASTIIALAPMMKQLQPYLTGSLTESNNGDLVSKPGQTQKQNDLVYKPNVTNNPWANLMNLSWNPNGMPGNPGMNGGVNNTGAVMAPGSVTQAINYWSQQYGVPGYIAYSIADAESGMRANASGDKGTSWGLFQLHQNGGQGTGYSAAQLSNPMLNAQIGLRSIAAAYQKAKAAGISEGPQMAQWVAQNSGHPGYGVHTSLDDTIRNNASNLLNGKLQIQGANLNITVKQPDGSVQKHQVPITATAEYTGQDPLTNLSSYGPS